MNLLLCTILAALTALACKNGKAEQKQTGTDTTAISKKDTVKLANFPGTAVYIQLPNGFAWSDPAMGFYKEEDGSVIKHDAFKTMRYAAKMPVGETMGSLTNKQPIMISGYKGELKTFLQGSTGIQLELSFGDNTFMEFIEATYFSHREQTGKDILSALKTIQVKSK
jgi:hypothetical protein